MLAREVAISKVHLRPNFELLLLLNRFPVESSSNLIRSLSTPTRRLLVVAASVIRMESHKMVHFLSLPPELLGQIMAASDLNSLRSLSTTCSTLRAIGNEEGIAVSPLSRALIATGNRMATEGPFSDDELSSIQKAARLSPVNSLLGILAVASRRFLLYQFEIPRLSGEQWKRICSSRFLASVIEKFERIVEEQGGRAGIWRELYMRRIHNYEMLSQGTTAPNPEAMVRPSFVVVESGCTF